MLMRRSEETLELLKILDSSQCQKNRLKKKQLQLLKISRTKRLKLLRSPKLSQRLRKKRLKKLNF
jgi:hypothetical protein